MLMNCFELNMSAQNGFSVCFFFYLSLVTWFFQKPEILNIQRLTFENRRDKSSRNFYLTDSVSIKNLSHASHKLNGTERNDWTAKNSSFFSFFFIFCSELKSKCERLSLSYCFSITRSLVFRPSISITLSLNPTSTITREKNRKKNKPTHTHTDKVGSEYIVAAETTKCN